MARRSSSVAFKKIFGFVKFLLEFMKNEGEGETTSDPMRSSFAELIPNPHFLLVAKIDFTNPNYP